MRDLVPEVAEQGAVRLAHLTAAALPLGIVGFGEVDGDEPVLVAGQDRSGTFLIGQEVEGEAFGVFRAGHQRQT